VTIRRDQREPEPAGHGITICAVAERAVDFCCLEAPHNIATHAHASQAWICLQAQNGPCTSPVLDDGTGYDTRHTPMGPGL
jgi:glucose-6-phosphate-specific signal transduction histidine kinase